MAFLDIQFPRQVARGAQGGACYSTDVVVLGSGHEQVNQNWSVARGRWNVAHGVKSQAALDELIAHFRIAKGRANWFRFRDWADFEVSTSTGRLGTGAVGTGGPTYQLYKRYSHAAGSEDRLISLPESGGVTVYRGATPVVIGAGAGEIAIDYTTGIVTFVPDASKSILAISKASPGVIQTSTAHGYSTGDLIYLASIGGMTELNGTVVTITEVGADEFSIGVDTTGYTTYTSGGTAAKYPQAADALTWAGTFDVPARFDTDQMRAQVDDYGVYSWGEIPLVEKRV
jgi:uncharacterized protein (TIGR02217 family)